MRGQVAGQGAGVGETWARQKDAVWLALRVTRRKVQTPCTADRRIVRQQQHPGHGERGCGGAATTATAVVAPVTAVAAAEATAARNVRLRPRACTRRRTAG